MGTQSVRTRLGRPDAAIFASKMEVSQWSLMYLADGRRCDGMASTMTQSPSIANPMNSNTNASNTRVPSSQAVRLVGNALTLS